jgi:hypothetical protein
MNPCRQGAITLCTSILLVLPSLATHLEPRKAKRFRADLVTAYEPCAAPNAIADESGMPACVPPVRSDPACGFGPKGTGSVKFAVANNSLAVSLRLRGLDAGCEDSLLSIAVSVAATTDDCAGSACTTEDFRPGFAGCQVKNGRCSFSGKGPLDAIAATGTRSGLEIRAVDVVRGGGRPFTMGLFVP